MKTSKLLTILFIALCTMVSLNAVPTKLTPLAMQTTQKTRNETKYVVFCMERAHYQRSNIQDLDTREFIREYMSNLDFMHLFFLSEDVQHYQDLFAPTIDIMLHQGTLLPAFTIYDRFLERAKERVEWIKEHLEKPFDLNEEGLLEIDRTKQDWPASMSAADELWDKRIRFDIVTQILTYDNPEKDSKKKKKSKSIQVEETEENTPKTFDEKFAKAKEEVLKRYTKILEYAQKSDPVEIQEFYLNALCSMYDPHSSFLSEYSLEEFDIAVRNSLVGIGAMLQDKDGYCTIAEIMPGGPAEKCKELKEGDKIVAVGDDKTEMTDVIGMKLRKVVKMIRGDKNTNVRLKIEPASNPSATYTLTLVRDEVKLTTKLAKASLYEIPNGDNKTVKIGVIDLPAFYGESENGQAKGFSTTKNVEELLLKLKEKNVEGIVLDMRRNGGGFLSEAVDLAGLFIETGPVVQVRDASGKSNTLSDTNSKVVWDGPLIVLVSKLSASATEIVAGALKNHERAIIVGDKNTHGKGTVQAVYHLENFESNLKSAAKVTVQKWYSPNGESIQVKGVHSDITFPSIYDEMEIGEANKDYALKWDAIESVNKTKPYNYGVITGNPQDLIAKLRFESENRRANLDEFKFYQERVDFATEKQKQKELPIAYEVRKAKVEEDKKFIDNYDEKIKEYAAQNYASEEILLDSAAELAKESEKSAETEGDAEKVSKADDADSDSSDFDDLDDDDAPKFDIQLRETLRIMCDWLNKPAALAIALEGDTK